MSPLDKSIRELERLVKRKPLEKLLDLARLRVSELKMTADALEDEGWVVKDLDFGVSLTHPFRPATEIIVNLTRYITCRYGDYVVEVDVVRDHSFTYQAFGTTLLTNIVDHDPREDVLCALEISHLMSTAVSAVTAAKKTKKYRHLRFLDSRHRADRRMLRGEPIFARITSERDYGALDRRASDVEGIVADMRKP
jgi:hypothetical protein